MKKIYIYISLFVFAALTLGCSKEVDIQDELPDKDEIVATGDGETITVTLSVPESEDTKTTLGAKDGNSYPVLWSAGDVITLNGTAATEFTPASGNSSATAKFYAGKDAQGHGKAFNSPYNFLYLGVAGQSNQVTFPSTQAYVAGGFDPAAMPMYASLAARTDNVTFSHVASLLKFSFTGSKKIDSVTLTAADGTKSLSGTFTIGAGSNGVLNGSLTPASGGGAINYNFGGHIQLSDDPFVFYVAIPAGTYEGGITLTVVDNNSGHMNITVMDSDDTKTIAAGRVREFNNVVYVQEKDAHLKMIWNLTTFQEFVEAVAGPNGDKTLNARLTPSDPSINLSSIAGSFASIEDYKGTFDGNGKTLDFGTSTATQPLFADLQGVVKNLTVKAKIEATASDSYHWGIFAKQIIPSIEVDDAPGLQNCTTASGSSITWTPSSAISSYMTLGGLVGNNNGGTITGCTNNATVTFANNGVSNGNQPSIGGVVGRTQKGGDLKTQGDISNCTNYGTVVCAAEFSQNIYIGGVIGYQVEKAESMSGCVNHGLVKVASTASTGAALQLGGVAGMAKGVMENCTNASDGVVTSEACSVTTYLNQGGVVGRLNNDAGLTYETLTNAGTLNVAATGSSSGAYVGGVVGRANEGAVLNGITNSGSINYTADSDVKTFIGGVTADNTNNSLVNCHSTGGAISYTGISLGTPSGANCYIGGIVAYSTKPITNCTNAMAVEMGGAYSPASDKYWAVGGIVAQMGANQPITSCLNTGNISFSLQIGGSKGYSFLGGVAGRSDGDIIDSSNGGTVTFSGKNDAQNPMIGGLVGDTVNDSGVTISGKYSTASATNYGNVVVNTSAQSKKWVYVGGIAGRGRATITATNAGQINVTNLTCTRFYLGGIAGTNTVALGSGCANLADGDITVSGLTVNEYYYIGGVVGLNSAAVTGNNAGDVIVTNGSTSVKSLFLGGVVGRGEANISSCTNTGAVSNGCPVTTADSYLQVGGVVGYNNGSSEVSSCHNTGNVSNSGNCNGYLYIGGITSEADALVSNCYNTGSVTNSGNSGNGKWIAIGGVVGFLGGANLTSCSNGTSSAAGGTVSNSGTSNEDVCIGGVVGTNDGYTLTTCYNKGAVTNTGNSNSGYNVNIGGLVGWSSAGSSYASTCYNTGAISNTGIGSNSSAPGVRMGGLFGCAKGLHSMSGSSCYNNGTVTENSSSSIAYIGGICGFYLDADGQVEATSFAGIQNRSSGTITMSGTHHTAVAGGVLGSTDYSVSLSTCSNAGAINYTNCITDNVRVGGILGVTGGSGVPNISGTDSSHWTINTGNIKFTTCTVADQVTAGGIFGSWENDVAATIQYCKNSGTITTNTQGTNSEDICTENMSYFSYVAGIGTCTDGGKGKTFTHCQNTGDIKLYFQSKHRVGGITAMCVIPPSYCDVQADLIVGMPGTPNEGNGGIGGIAAVLYDSSHSSLTFNNLYFNGNVRAEYNHGDKRSYITGLLAARPSNTGTTLTFNNCKVGGEIYCNQWSGWYRSGLFIGHNIASSNLANAHTINCSGCQVLTGTIVQYGTGVDTITSNVTYRQAVGNTGPNSSQSGTVSGISVVNSISPNIAFN